MTVTNLYKPIVTYRQNEYIIVNVDHTISTTDSHKLISAVSNGRTMQYKAINRPIVRCFFPQRISTGLTCTCRVPRQNNNNL